MLKSRPLHAAFTMNRAMLYHRVKYVKRVCAYAVFCMLWSTAFQSAFAKSTFSSYAGCPLDYQWEHRSFENAPFSLDKEVSEAVSSNNVIITADTIKTFANSSSSQSLDAYAQFSGGAYLRRGELDVYGDEIVYFQNRGNAHIKDAYLSYKGLRFWSDTASLKKNQDMDYQQTTFSRCGGAYDNLDWRVSSAKIHYDNEDNSLTFHDSRLDFYNIPVFYFPWINIPLSRRSGLLFPKVGQKSLSAYDWSGYFYSQPVYLNLGENQDMTHSFSWLQNRSVLLSNQYRYLNSWVDLEVNHDWMEQDAILPQLSDADDYRRLSIYSTSKFLSHWTLSTQWMELSVRSFHELFPTSILEKPVTGFFNRKIQLTGDYGKHKYTAQVHQNISLNDELQDNYITVPALSYSYKNGLSARQDISLGVASSRLISPVHRNLRNYQYLQLKPVWKWKNYTGFLESHLELGSYHNQYSIDAYTDDNNITAPQQNIDYHSIYGKVGGSLHFINTQAWYPQGMYSKLSPLLYYIYSPYRSPESIPFASYSAQKISAFRSLLQVKRYNRDDFIGESNRVVSGISQTLFSHQWKLRATLGKNHDISAPTTLSALPQFDPAFDYWFGELAYNFGLLRANLNTQWENLTDANPKRIFSQLYYENEQKDVARINYSRAPTEQTDNSILATDSSMTEYIGLGFSYQWNNIRLASQADYRLSSNQLSSYMVGAVYDSCCWQVNAIIEGESSSIDSSQLNYTINLGLTFKGLVAVGPSIKAEEKIYKRVTAEQ